MMSLILGPCILRCNDEYCTADYKSIWIRLTSLPPSPLPPLPFPLPPFQLLLPPPPFPTPPFPTPPPPSPLPIRGTVFVSRVPPHISIQGAVICSTAGELVLVCLDNVITIELVQDGDQCTSVPVVCHSSPIVALSRQVL